MRKRITLITLIALCMSSLSLHAGIRVGVKGGVNLANAVINPEVFQTENFTGFQVGPIIEISGLTGFGIDAAVLYSQNGLKFKNFPTESKISTLDVPVNLKLKFSLVDMAGFYVTAGPYVSFAVDEQTSYKTIETDFIDKHFGTGLNFGAGFELLRHLQVGVNYQLALNNDYSNDSPVTDLIGSSSLPEFKAKSRIWSITAAYFF